jgi:hypothetical protein
MFESTLPAETAELMRVSAFRRFLEESQQADPEHSGNPSSTLNTRLSSLNPSLLEDLMRFDQPGRPGARLEPLEVLAAAVRHGRRLRLHLQHQGLVLPVTIFPFERLVHCPLPMAQLLAMQLAEMEVLHVQPAPIDAPGGGSFAAGSAAMTLEQAQHYSALGPLMWELALRGAREELLPGADLTALQLTGSLAAAVTRLQRETTNLRELSTWPAFDRGRAMRLLNGLYLQAALMISRTHPAATNEGWTPPN